MSSHKNVVNFTIPKLYSCVVVVISSPTVTVQRSSSVISRFSASRADSSGSILPPGNSQSPARGPFPR